MYRKLGRLSGLVFVDITVAKQLRIMHRFNVMIESVTGLLNAVEGFHLLLLE